MTLNRETDMSEFQEYSHNTPVFFHKICFTFANPPLLNTSTELLHETDKNEQKDYVFVFAFLTKIVHIRSITQAPKKTYLSPSLSQPFSNHGGLKR